MVSSAGGDVVSLHGSGFRGGVDRMLRFPTRVGDAATRNDTAGARAVCRFGRGASMNDAVIESPATIAADGESATCVSPAFPGGGAGGGVVVVEFCDPASSCCSDPEPMAPLASRSLYPARFLPPSLTVAAAERARVAFRRAEVTSVAPAAVDARLGAVAHLKGWGFDGFGGAATCAFTFARTRSFVAGSDPNMSSALVTLTSQARIVSGAEATCELPALDPSLVPPGARLAVSATLALHGGAVSVTAPTPILAVAADAAPGASALELADNLQVSRRASSALLAYVRGAKEGGLAVALRTRAKAEAENENDASFDPAATRAFPDLMSGGIDAACAFGTVVVAARRLGARRVECVSPAAPRENATAPLAATARAAGARFDGVGVGETRDFRVLFEWRDAFANASLDSKVAGVEVLAALYAERAAYANSNRSATRTGPSPFVVASQGGASGPADGGWLLSLRGVFRFSRAHGANAFSCAFTLPARDGETAGSLGAPFATAPARVVSGALIVCEVPAVARDGGDEAGTGLRARRFPARVSVRESRSSLGLSNLSPPDEETAPVSFVEFEATAPLADGASLALADGASRVVAAGGGSVVGVVGGNLAAETGDELACRFRAVVVAARRGARGAAECVSPALARRVTALADPAPFAFGAAADLVDFAVGASRVAGMLGAEAPEDAGLGLVVAPATDGALASAAASPAPTRGASRGVALFASLDAASAAPRRLALALNVTSPQASDALTDLPPDWVANPSLRARVSLLCVAGSDAAGDRASRAGAGAEDAVSAAAAALAADAAGVAHAATCDAPPAPFERALGGFATVSVRVAFGTGIVRGMRFAELEFEWAAPPPARLGDVARRVRARLGDRRGGAGARIRRVRRPRALVAPGARDAILRGLRDRPRVRGAQRHARVRGRGRHGPGGGVVARRRRARAPRRAHALAGADFRAGAGLRARFSAVAAEASAAVAAGFAHERSVVRAWFVSSALILVEPPAMPPRVADGARRRPGGRLRRRRRDAFSDAAAAHRVRARARRARAVTFRFLNR